MNAKRYDHRSPVAPDGRERNHQVGLKVTHFEFEALNHLAKKAGINRTEYILQRTVYARELEAAAPAEAHEVKEHLLELRRLMRRAGNNVNQMAYALNRVIRTGSTYECKQGLLERALDNAEKALPEIRSALRAVEDYVKELSLGRPDFRGMR